MRVDRTHNSLSLSIRSISVLSFVINFIFLFSLMSHQHKYNLLFASFLQSSHSLILPLIRCLVGIRCCPRSCICRVIDRRNTRLSSKRAITCFMPILTACKTQISDTRFWTVSANMVSSSTIVATPGW